MSRIYSCDANIVFNACSTTYRSRVKTTTIFHWPRA